MCVFVALCVALCASLSVLEKTLNRDYMTMNLSELVFRLKIITKSPFLLCLSQGSEARRQGLDKQSRCSNAL